ncbi:MAG: DNA polymerase III subunit beta [bacterium]
MSKLKIKIEQKVLYDAIKLVGKSVAKKEVYPVATGILIEAKNDKLKLFSTNFIYGIEKTINDCEIIEEGSAVIKGALLQSYVSKLSNGEITITSKDNHKAIIKTGMGKVKLDGFNPIEFPSRERFSEDKLTLNQSDLKYLFDKTKYSANKDAESSEPALAGIKLESNGDSLTSVATNIYRLSCINKPIEGLSKPIDVILPVQATDTLSDLLRGSEVDIYIKESWIKFDFGKTQLYSRIIDGKFPDYKKVLPTESNFNVSIDKEQLLSAIERIMVISKNKNFGESIIKISVDDANTYITVPEYEDNIEILESEKEGDNFNIKVDGNYLIDFLKNTDKSVVELSGLGKENPLILRERDNEDWTYLVMPVR